MILPSMNHEAIASSVSVSRRVEKDPHPYQFQQQQQQQQQQQLRQQPCPWGGDFSSEDDDDNESEGSIDFSALEDYFPSINKPNSSCSSRRRRRRRSSMLNDCSHADTLSTAGESSSWGSSTCEYNSEDLANATNEEEEQNNDDDDDDDDSECSLTLEDLKAFFVEDQVGIFNPTRDDLPPPKARTDYKGDSQNSFGLEDLELDFFEPDNDEEQDDADNEDSLGCLLAPATNRRQSQQRGGGRRRKSSRRKSSQLLLQEKLQQKQEPTLKGILKNGTCNTRRSSSLTMLMMEDSSMFQLSLTGGGLLLGDDNDDDTVGFDDSMDGWGLLQQSFTAEAALDLQALEEKRVEFSTVIVHSHPVVVGDNPSVSEGVPLQLDWKAEDSTTYESLEDYEGTKKLPATSSKATATTNPNTNTTTNSSGAVRKLEAQERMFLLLNAGATLQEIQQAEAIVNKTRHEREATRQSNLLGCTGQRTVFWKAIQKQVQEQEEDLEPELLPPIPAPQKR